MTHQQFTISPEILAALRSKAGPDTTVITLEDFIDCSLYDPQIGYYRRPGRRVGREQATDFYTGPSLGQVFSMLVVDAVRQLCGAPVGTFTFVEAGPESPNGILGGLAEMPFADSRLIRPGDPFEIPPKSVVFSNELFDAQPFRRFVHRDGRWLEGAVNLGSGSPVWVEIEPVKPLPPLPSPAPEGYMVDWPSGAHSLLERICRQSWQGLFIAVDYGMDRHTLLHERPAGTARTYSAHRMGTNVLENPGSVDITCHVVWDEMEDILAANGFTRISLLRQEAFFMRHAAEAIGAILEAGAAGFSREKQTLMELLHPDNMGRKFQVLTAARGKV